MKLTTLMLALCVSSTCFAQSILMPAQENWLSPKETKQLASLRAINPSATPIKFSFNDLGLSDARVVTTPDGKTHTFTGGPTVFFANRPDITGWKGIDEKTGAFFLIMKMPDGSIEAGITDQPSTGERGHAWEIHALGDGYYSIADSAQVDIKDKTRRPH